MSIRLLNIVWFLKVIIAHIALLDKSGVHLMKYLSHSITTITKDMAYQKMTICGLYVGTLFL